MSRVHVRIQIQFPHVKVLILGVLISLLGLGEIIIGILAFTHKIWGHYLGTGLWGGILIFVSGICAITASQIRAPIFAKIYFATSVVGMLVSFVMLVLSSGGLDYDSNFYHFKHFNPYKHIKKHNATIMVHGMALAFSIFSFLANVASVVICMKYVVFDRKFKYTTERTGRKSTNTGSLERRMLRGDIADIRASTNSRAPLTERSSRRSRSRRGSDQGSRRRSETEEFLPDGSNSRRNKDRRRRNRREQRREQTENGGVREGGNRNESRNRRNERNEIPVPVQVERMTIYDGVTRSNVHPEDLLPTHFNEDELPPYEEAIRDTYVPISDLNNHVLSINTHITNSSEHDCDIADEKIYENVECVRAQQDRQSEPVSLRPINVRERGGMDGGNDSSINHPSTSQVRSATRVKNVQEERQNETNEEIELYVNVPPRQERLANKNVKPSKSSVSTSALCKDSDQPQTRRCTSSSSAVSLPTGNPSSSKPLRFYSAKSDLRNIDSSGSDSSLGLNVPKGKIAGKNYVNVEEPNSLSAFEGPGFNLLNGTNAKPDLRNSSRYKADYYQLHIRQDPEGSSCTNDKELPSTSGISTRQSGKIDRAQIHSSPKGSPSTRKSGKSSGTDKGTAQDSGSPSARAKTVMKGSENKMAFTFPDNVSETSVSPITISSPSSLNWSCVSPIRFASPTSAFKPYRRCESSSSSGVTSPTSESDFLSSPLKLSDGPETPKPPMERQTSWKDIMLPSDHSLTDKKTEEPAPQAHPRKLSAMVNKTSKPDSPKMSGGTFPRPTPIKLSVPPLPSMKGNQTSTQDSKPSVSSSSPMNKGGNTILATSTSSSGVSSASSASVGPQGATVKGSMSGQSSKSGATASGSYYQPLTNNDNNGNSAILYDSLFKLGDQGQQDHVSASNSATSVHKATGTSAGLTVGLVSVHGGTKAKGATAGLSTGSSNVAGGLSAGGAGVHKGVQGKPADVRNSGSVRSSSNRGNERQTIAQPGVSGLAQGSVRSSSNHGNNRQTIAQPGVAGLPQGSVRSSSDHGNERQTTVQPGVSGLAQGSVRSSSNHGNERQTTAQPGVAGLALQAAPSVRIQNGGQGIDQGAPSVESVRGNARVVPGQRQNNPRPQQAQQQDEQQQGKPLFSILL